LHFAVKVLSQRTFTVHLIFIPDTLHRDDRVH